MLSARDRSPMPAGSLPHPAPLPSLRDALDCRAAVFGRVEADEAPAPPRGTWRTLGGALRRMV